MSEPHEAAQQVEQIAPGVWHWHLHDNRIDFVSSSHAVTSDEGTVLIDPLPLGDDAMAQHDPQIDGLCVVVS